MQLTGHKTENVYRRYAIVAENDLREAGAKLTAASLTALSAMPAAAVNVTEATDLNSAKRRAVARRAPRGDAAKSSPDQGSGS